MNSFLKENIHLLNRIKANVDIHPCQADLKKFQQLAKEIDNERYFSIYGCQSCARTLVLFVYENQKQLPLKVKSSFPKHIKNESKK